AKLSYVCLAEANVTRWRHSAATRTAVLSLEAFKTYIWDSSSGTYSLKNAGEGKSIYTVKDRPAHDAYLTQKSDLIAVLFFSLPVLLFLYPLKWRILEARLASRLKFLTLKRDKYHHLQY
ncbi:hypothetical protein MHYP_G00327210, partial [Metynnis hypsauchen]